MRRAVNRTSEPVGTAFCILYMAKAVASRVTSFFLTSLNEKISPDSAFILIIGINFACE